MEYTSIDACVEDFESLDEEFRQFEEVHRNYLQKIDELNTVQEKCVKGLSHQKYRINQISESMDKLSHSASPEDLQKMEELKGRIEDRKHQFYEIVETLPKTNSLYLKIILGNVNVSILNRADKFKYKDEYEKFKLVITILTFVFSFFNLFVIRYRFMDAAFHFLLVWYYCTLTIRESILIVNGSRIKGWWLAHHYISTVLAGILLIWPDGARYQKFRNQFMLHQLYMSFVQLLQFNYQRGCLYRLKALGERHNMDITIEGFHSWMWRGLSFLLPFLFSYYFFQFYNAYVLYQISQQPDCIEWHVLVLSGMFLLMFFGNTLTTLAVIRQKVDGAISQDSFTKYKAT